MSTVSSTVAHVDTQKGTCEILLHKECEPIHAVACHPKQPAVAMGNRRGVLKVWDYNDKVVIYSRVFETEKQIQCVTFDPQGEPTCTLTVFATNTCAAFVITFCNVKSRIVVSPNRIIPGRWLWQRSGSHTEPQHFTK